MHGRLRRSHRSSDVDRAENNESDVAVAVVGVALPDPTAAALWDSPTTSADISSRSGSRFVGFYVYG